MVTYCNAPTMLRDRCGLVIGSPPRDNLESGSARVAMGLAPVIFLRSRRSNIYLRWDSKREVDERCTSMPKKKLRAPKSFREKIELRYLTSSSIKEELEPIMIRSST